MDNFNFFVDESTFDSFFTVGGLIVNKNEKKIIIDEFNAIKRDLWPKESKREIKRRIIHLVDVKIAHYHNNQQYFNTVHKYPYYKNVFFPNSTYKTLFRKISKLINEHETKLICSSISAQNMKHEYSMKYADWYVIAFQKLLDNYLHFLVKNNATGSIIVEDNTSRDKIMKEFYGFKFLDQSKFSNRVVNKHIKELFFIPKDNSSSPLLQIADVVVGATVKQFSETHSYPERQLYSKFQDKFYDGNLNRVDVFGNTFIEY
ncbi:DUF3800 domain-containing protein [Fructilactobacillus hinvesii]|uniref:DUF3800 domain-containing protein n=1 Tax=Fructilactobacillus hinvesii TaxID=2940300 RepID=A0ABY5BTI9_9LACO|nr:DUF3800 domain-containing protein [Fructilactobacillus hinvesii]USS88448.1 DUF3800 domain-containing protein [Fructilactobacillus hinvesii]